MRRYGILLAAIALIAVCVLGVNRLLPGSQTDRYNVILISVDSFRADHMGLYGYERSTTPRIDAWAKDAVVFDRYFSTAYLTPISEASVHTGRYPFTNGVINFESAMRESVPTLAQVLKQNGWETAAFLSSPEYYNYPALKSSFSRGFDTYTLGTSRTYYPRGSDPAAAAIEWLATRGDEPFFIWLAIGSVHWPYGQDEPNHFSDPAYEGLFNTAETRKSGLIWRDLFGFIYDGVKYSTTLPVRPTAQVGKEDFDYLIGRYDDGIVRTDRRIGELFDYLDKTGLAENTVVILQSEHGEALGERGYIAHYDIYDESVHVPLIVKAPDLAAKRVGALASGVDVMPTLLSLLGLPAPAVDGVDLLPYLAGATSTEPRREVYLSRTPLWERIFSSDQQSQALFFPSAIPITSTSWADFVAADNVAHYYDTAIRSEKWKLIHRLTRTAPVKYSWWSWLTGKTIALAEYELYDLERDPDEARNVYGAYARDPVVQELRAKLTAWEANMKASIPGPTPAQEIQPYF